MKIKTIIIVLGMFLPILSIRAQDARPLSIGDTVPDLVLHNVINYKDSVIRLSDFKDKLVILDFWATWCGSCIAQFGRMEKIKEQLGDRVVFLMVNEAMTGNTSKEIARFQIDYQKRSGIRLSGPVVVQDTVLSKKFPHTLLPHYVWIAGDRTFKGVTSFASLTESNMRKALTVNAGPDTMPHRILYKSIFSSYTSSRAGMAIQKNEEGSITSVSISNMSLPDMFRTAYPGIKELFYPNRTIVSAKAGKLWLETDYTDSAVIAITYCYDLNAPPISLEHANKILGRDLENFFGISVRRDTSSMDCIAITSIPEDRGLSQPRIDLRTSTLRKYIYGVSLDSAVALLNHYAAVPIVALAKNAQKVNIVDLPQDLRNQVELEKALSKNGILFTKTKRNFPIAYIDIP